MSVGEGTTGADFRYCSKRAAIFVGKLDQDNESPCKVAGWLGLTTS
jgi:hypothetical protein